MGYPMRKIILLGVVLILGVGCGRKVDPVPWESVVPKRIVDLQALSREGNLLLEWSAPKENTDKSVLTDLASFQVLRSEGDLVADECRGCTGSPKVVSEMKWSGKEEFKGKRISILFEDLQARKGYVFQVLSVNERGHAGAPSNPVQVYWDYPPQQPRVVYGERGDKKTELSWEPVIGATGYNIYRRTEEEIFSLDPLNKGLLKETHYTDLNVENEKKYIYTVRVVRRVVKTDVEGKSSLELSMTPTDLIPPGPPGGLVAIPLKNGVELNWRRSREPDLLGYNVYRRKGGENEFRRLTKDPLPKETFLDTDVEVNQDYEYAVTAVDRSPRKNESPRSEETRVEYIY